MRRSKGQRLILATQAYKYTASHYTKILRAINLVLDIFTEYEVFGAEGDDH